MRLKIKMIVLLIFILIILSITLISGYFSERVKRYIEQEVTLTSSKLITKTLEDGVLSNLDSTKLIKVVDGNIKSLYIDTSIINNILKEVNSTLEEIVVFDNNIEGIKLPLSIIFSDVLFSKFGPWINVEIVETGSFKTDIHTDLQDFGINNTLLSLYLIININYEAIIPMVTNVIQVVTKIPLIVEVIQGDIPSYYYQNSNSEYIPIKE